MTTDQVVYAQDLLQVVAGGDRRLALLVVPRPQAPEQTSAEALDRRGRQHAFGGAADSPQQVDPPSLGDGEECRRDVAVGDEADPGAGLADLPHRVLVAGWSGDDY